MNLRSTTAHENGVASTWYRGLDMVREEDRMGSSATSLNISGICGACRNHCLLPPQGERAWESLSSPGPPLALCAAPKLLSRIVDKPVSTKPAARRRLPRSLPAGRRLEHSENDIDCEPEGGSHDKPTTEDVGGTPAPQLFTIDNSRLHPRGKQFAEYFGQPPDRLGA